MANLHMLGREKVWTWKAHTLWPFYRSLGDNEEPGSQDTPAVAVLHWPGQEDTW